MNAVDRLALAALGEHHVKRAWLNNLYEGLGGAKGIGGAAADIGMSSLPVVGGIYGGVRGVMDLAHGQLGSGLMRLGGAALNIGTLGAGGVASGALQGAGRLARYAPTIAKGLGKVRSTGMFNTASKVVTPARASVLKGIGKPTMWSGAGVMGGQALRGGGEAAAEAGEGALPVEEMLNMARSHVLSNPMYAQPGFHPLPNPAGLY